MDIDSLEKYWPLISKYPWAFAWTFFTGGAAGFGLHKLWTMWTSVKPEQVSTPAPAPAPKKTPSIAKEPFKPTELQIACVRVLRNFDDEWVQLDQVASDVGPQEARADVRQALEVLIATGWVSDRQNYVYGPSYRLKGPGLDFAREHGFPVEKRSGY